MPLNEPCCLMAPLVEAGRPAKRVSEVTRERETFRYNPSLVAEFNFLRDGNLVPSSKLASSADATLTGLAQLGAYQTGTDRAFISVFDANHQYVIAETVPSMRIAPSLANDDLTSTLALCGCAIPRDQGTCDHVLYLQANPDSSDPAELPLSFVPNLVTDPRFSNRPYCQFGEAGQFYAAVPIRTRRGINIGAYCVMSQKSPQGWNEESPRHLRDVSHAIMDYLEQRRIMSMSRAHERLNRGLGSFIEGKNTLGRWQNQLHHEAFISAPHKREGVLNAKQQHMERQKPDTLEEAESVQRDSQGEELRGDYIPAEAVSGVDGSASSQRPAVRRSTDSSVTGNGFNPAAKDADAVEDEPRWVFSRAANIIREAYEVEGCVFMDVAIGAYTLPPDSNPSESAGHVSSTSSGEEGTNANQTKDPTCEVLGFSTTDISSINGDDWAINGDGLINDHSGNLPSRFLAKLLRRYPNGRIFNFDAIGELQQTDSSEEDTASDHPPNSELVEQKSSEKHRGAFSQAKEGDMIHQAFPYARSVAFMPVRDLKRDRWLAGGFVYTLESTRVLSDEGELSFLRAFEKAITSELLKLETRRIEKAKSDALGSLSHELRSPLHGLILGTELLNDTELSGFQGNTTHMIETCGRTLLDTIDHLLEYSKINRFERNSRKESSAYVDCPPRLRKRTRSSQFSKKLYTDIRLDGIIEEVAQSVFAGFNFQYKSIRQLSSQKSSTSTDLTAHKQLDGMQAMEQLNHGQDTDQGRESFQIGLVSVYLCIDSACNWTFYMQPGAIRRIFMNLFGNSLKYTTSGYIRVSLTQEPHNVRQSNGEKLVQLTVQDTGKGIGQDFMRHRLFKPFSQEDELTPGTGLGLSLVKTMVSQLGGRINVQSQCGVGTTIVVRLPLEQSSQGHDMPRSIAERDETFEEQLRELRGLRVRICGFDGADDERGIVEGICCDWLKMEVVADSGNSPDVVLRSSSTLPDDFEMIAQLAMTPNVVVCTDALAAYKQLKKYESIGQGGVLEFISQPIGPRIFAQSLLLVYQRWMGLAKIKPQARPRGPRRAQSLYNSNRLLVQSDVARELPIIMPEAKSEAGFLGTENQRADGEPALLESATDGASKILLVDDNCINLKILAAYMSRLGCAHEMAVNGKEAVNTYVAHPEQFAAILMDISMPIMDGLEATRVIRSHERTNKLEKVAILVLTGLASESIHREASESGVDIFLTKPVRLKVLGKALESINILTENGS